MEVFFVRDDHQRKWALQAQARKLRLLPGSEMTSLAARRVELSPPIMLNRDGFIALFG